MPKSSARALFVSTGQAGRIFGLSRYDLARLRQTGAVHAVRATEKKWLYRVADLVRHLETGADGVVRDEAYYEDLAAIEAAVN